MLLSFYIIKCGLILALNKKNHEVFLYPVLIKSGIKKAVLEDWKTPSDLNIRVIFYTLPF